MSKQKNNAGLNLAILFFALVLNARVSIAQQLHILADNYFPLQIVKEGEVGGVATDIVKLTVEEAGVDYKIEVGLWSDIYQQAQENPNTCVYSIARNEQRVPLFAWIGRIIRLEGGVFSAADKDIILSSLEDAKAYKTVVVKDDAFYQYIRSKGFVEDEHYYAIRDYDALMKFLETPSRDFDLTIGSDAMFKYHMAHSSSSIQYKKRLALDELKLDFYLACNKSTDPMLLKRLSTTMSELEESGKFEQIRAKY